MGRPSNSQQRRGEIADALIRVIAEVGFERATIAAIARSANLRSGLVHYHFHNKEEILLLAIERMGERMQARYVARRAAAADTPLSHLHALVDAHVALGPDADPTAVAAWVAVGAVALGQAPVRAAYARVMKQRAQQIHTLVSACLRESRGTAHGAGDVTAALLSAIEGAYQLSATAPELLPRGFAAPSLRRMISGLLAPE